MIIAVNEAMIENCQGGQRVYSSLFLAAKEADHDGHSVFFSAYLEAGQWPPGRPG